MIGSSRIYDLSLKIMKEVKEQSKSRAITNFIRGVANNGFYYKALKYIPYYISSAAEFELYNEILHAEVIDQMQYHFIPGSDKTGWEVYEDSHYKVDFMFDYERYEEGGRHTYTYTTGD